MDSMETVIKKENQKVLNTGSISTPSWSNCQNKDNCSFGDDWLSCRVVYKANATKKEDTVMKKTTLARRIRRGHSSTQYKPFILEQKLLNTNSTDRLLNQMVNSHPYTHLQQGNHCLVEKFLITSVYRIFQ